MADEGVPAVKQRKLTHFFKETPKLSENPNNTTQSNLEVPDTSEVLQSHVLDPQSILVKKIRGEAISQEERTTVLEWNRPLTNQQFPPDKNNRRFSNGWMKSYSWLVFVNELGGGVCKDCVLFQTEIGATEGSRCQPHQQLATSILRDLKNGASVLKAHEASAAHRACAERARLHRRHYAAELDIRNSLQTQRLQEIKENRAKLRGIVETILFLGRHDAPFRGRYDFGEIRFNEDGAGVQGEGMFRAALRFRVDAGDCHLKDLLTSNPKYVTYASPKIQNEIQVFIGEHIRAKLVHKIKINGHFAVLMDETTDSARIEQVSLVIRSVNSEGTVEEVFLGFMPTTDTSGRGMADLLLRKLQSLGLDIALLRGQGYDGAASMMGRFNGCQAVILEKQPLAVFVHCFNHRLNLVIGKACSLPEFKNLFGSISKICDFFCLSPKKTNHLQQTIEEDETSSLHTKRRIKSYCATRWVERHNCVVILVDLFPFVVKVLNELGDEGDASARGLLGAMSTPSFCCALAVTNELLQLTHPVSKALQNPSQHLGDAYERVARLMTTVDQVNFGDIYDKTVILSESLGVTLKPPRQSREDDPKAYFRRTLFEPFRDCLKEMLMAYFASKPKILSLQELLPGFTRETTLQNVASCLKDYEVDLEGSVPEAISQVRQWLKELEDSSESSGWSLEECVRQSNKMFLPAVGKLLRLFAVVPATTASSERSFSHLRRLKTWLRSTMGEERLDALALLSSHIDEPVDVEAIIDAFRDAKHRRLAL